jgi:hypothetical protein
LTALIERINLICHLNLTGAKQLCELLTGPIDVAYMRYLLDGGCQVIMWKADGSD